MTMRQIRCGVACCGKCGSHLEIVCSAGCEDAEPEFQTDYSLYRRVLRARIAKPSHCTYPGCTDPIAPRDKAGRPPTQCVKHREAGRNYHRKLRVVV
jgi:hypothetical protein